MSDPDPIPAPTSTASDTDDAPSRSAAAAERLLNTFTAAMGERGETRPGQHRMCSEVAYAIAESRHLIVQAGTGTGKSLAYLSATIASGRTTVIATATKALQDQLASKELPFIAEHRPAGLEWAVLKGRSNYLCLQRLDEAASGTAQLDLETGGTLSPTRLKALQEWAATTTTGDRADLPEEPSAMTWSAVSVGPLECPGAAKCPRGDDCFAEAARRRAATAKVVVVNTHLYGLHLASGAMVLPPHDIVVFDEAHEVADTISATTGAEITGGRFEHVARVVGGLLEEKSMVTGLNDVAARLADRLGAHLGERLRDGIPADLAELLSLGRQRLMDATGAAGGIDSRSADVATRIARLQTAVGALVSDVDAVLDPPDGTVLWVDGDDRRPRLAAAPLDIGRTLDELLWNPEPRGLQVGPDDVTDPNADGSDCEFPGVPSTAIFTSATIPPTLPSDLGIPAGEVRVVDVGSPFDFDHQALLYCAASLPDPRTAGYLDAMIDELERLIDTAGGRTLALFTSYRAMEAAADALTDRVAHRILRQGELPKPLLVDTFSTDETSCLFATMGFWQGIDVAGPALSMVTLDKIPFPRPDEPLLAARREAAGRDAFRTIDLSRAATLLAQGAGRLIRRRTDRGVVAVLDPRLSSARSYRWELINALPPMRRTKDLDEVRRFFASTAPADGAAAAQ